ncbi:MAG: cytochrome c oxidase assembly protein [Gemmatimonadetes bacterium]|jgi:putative membrane protein|nr:cytochrome c oxidase assembly protein [Gemmatimonadota bacterium]
MQWWCSASGKPWTWEPQFYPGVWLAMIVLIVAFGILARRGRALGESRLVFWSGWTAVGLVWQSLDWPLGPLAAGYLASAHALQFLTLALVAPPLILLATRKPLAAAVPTAGRGRAVAMFLTQPIIAGVLFNLVTIATHVPGVVDTLMPTQLGAFAIDLLWFSGGIVLWWPLVVPAPSRAWFGAPVRMLYLFFATLVHTGIAMVMLVREFPMYGIYELAPPWEVWTPIEDQHLAGGVMELAGAAVIFGIITVMFFRWTGGVAGDNAPKAPPRD